jgi:hypothetical protein
MGKKRKNYIIVIEKLLGKCQIGRLRRRWGYQAYNEM